MSLDITIITLYIVYLFHMTFIIGYDSSIALPFSWDTVPLWADFYIRNTNKPIITDWRAKFIATHYSVISMEKCYSSKTWRWGHSQQASTSGVSDFCSNSINNPNSEKRPKYDHSKPYVRKWWIDTLMLCIRGAFERGLIIDGVFFDGVNVNTNTDIASLLSETRASFRAIEAEYDIDLFIMGNGLWNYNFWPSHNVEAIPYVDGLCIEHFAAFEELKHTDDSSIDPDKLLVWFDLIPAIINGKYGANKSVFIKAIIGPATQSDGKIQWPSWYGSIPTTNAEWQTVSAQLITFPLAVYLCGVAYDNVYFSYGWWYGIDHGFVPCPDSPSSCFSPLNWYQELTNDLGEPLNDPIMTDKYKCNRSFQHAHVYVDLSDDASGRIEWIPITQSPTESPTDTSSAPTEISAAPTNYPSVAPTLSISVMATASEHKYDGLLIQIILVILLVVVCVVYFCYKRSKMESNVQDINVGYRAM